jgi:uncharacterized protein YdiU (UPF0061 family)
MTDKLFNFDNSYALLPERFFSRLPPAAVSRPCLLAFNYALASDLGMNIESMDKERLAEVFSGNVIPAGAEPLAMAYAGHQFGYFVPQLGDGRAILLGEVVDRHGIRRDIQLKGSGQTPFSRQGDGRAALGPVIREYIVSEAMHALGIKTTRSLAAVTTGDPVYRQTILPGAVLTRVASSHIRIGTFEYFATRGDSEAVQRLADYMIHRLYPEAENAANPYIKLLENVMEAQSRLVASWMCIGFIHGVMNTDNMALSGETIDYGPCAFMDNYDPLKVFSSIDRYGRYAFGNQPHIAGWNLARFAETLLPLFDADSNKAVAAAEELLATFPGRFRQHWLSGMRRKLGLFSEKEGDILLIEEFLELMHKNNADYTLAFRLLCDAADENEGDAALRKLFSGEGIGKWLERWRTRLAQEPQTAAGRAQAMRLVNPAYIPRNHRIEQAIVAAVENGDFSLMDRLQLVLSNPYRQQDSFSEYALPPSPAECVTQTFCGT